MAKGKPSKRSKGTKATSTKTSKTKKPAVAKGQRAKQAKEPEGKKAGKPKGSSSKLSGTVRGLEKKLLKTTSTTESRKLLQKLEKKLKGFKRLSTKSRYEEKFKNLKKLQSNLIRMQGGAKGARKLAPAVQDIMSVLNKRGKQIGRKLKQKKSRKKGG